MSEKFNKREKLVRRLIEVACALSDDASRAIMVMAKSPPVPDSFIAAVEDLRRHEATLLLADRFAPVNQDIILDDDDEEFGGVVRG